MSRPRWRESRNPAGRKRSWMALQAGRSSHPVWVKCRLQRQHASKEPEKLARLRIQPGSAQQPPDSAAAVQYTERRPTQPSTQPERRAPHTGARVHRGMPVKAPKVSSGSDLGILVIGRARKLAQALPNCVVMAACVRCGEVWGQGAHIAGPAAGDREFLHIPAAGARPCATQRRSGGLYGRAKGGNLRSRTRPLRRAQQC